MNTQPQEFKYYYNIVYYFCTEDGFSGNASMTIKFHTKVEYDSDLKEIVGHIKATESRFKSVIIINIIPLKGETR